MSKQDSVNRLVNEWLECRAVVAELNRIELRGDNPSTLVDHLGRVWTWDGVWGPDDEPGYRHCGMFWPARFVLDPNRFAVTHHLADNPCEICAAADQTCGCGT